MLVKGNLQRWKKNNHRNKEKQEEQEIFLVAADSSQWVLLPLRTSQEVYKRPNTIQVKESACQYLKMRRSQIMAFFFFLPHIFSWALGLA